MDLRAGVAAVAITPTEPMWGAGYAVRDRPIESKLHDLWAKALAIEDADGGAVVLITTDLLGLPASLAEPVASQIARRLGLPRSAIMLTASHTHCGPVVRDCIPEVYPMPPQEWAHVEGYSDWLVARLVEVGCDSFARLEPASLSRGIGRAGFAMNRRGAGADGINLGVNPTGPVDNDVPVLAVRARDGALRAVLFGYACHCTTLDFYQWCGDYAGFAQQALEAAYPGTTAMFLAGCGADANPYPRRELEHCVSHGQALADAVRRVLEGEMHSLQGPLAFHLEHLDLPLAAPPPCDELRRRAESAEYAFERAWAGRLLARLHAGQPIPSSWPVPVQAVRFGHDLSMIAFGAEVVCEYALRLKGELGGDRTWVVAYANDVIGYIPTAAMLEEGGYEADLAVAVYGLPAKWALGVQDRMIAGALALARA